MFGVGISEIVLILIVALLVFGPEKLPEAAASVGRALAKCRSAAAMWRDEFYREISIPGRQLHQLAETVKLEAESILDSDDPPPPEENTTRKEAGDL